MGFKVYRLEPRSDAGLFLLGGIRGEKEIGVTIRARATSAVGYQ